MHCFTLALHRFAPGINAIPRKIVCFMSATGADAATSNPTQLLSEKTPGDCGSLVCRRRVRSSWCSQFVSITLVTAPGHAQRISLGHQIETSVHLANTDNHSRRLQVDP